MNNSMKVFSFLLLSLIGWIVFSAASGISSTPAMLVLPCLVGLVGYHVYLYRMGDLLQREVDSIYYLGFLITLSLLALSAFIFTSSHNVNIQEIGSQFALGLLATGYGLWARMTLQSKFEYINFDEQVTKYTENVGKLNDRFSETVNLFSVLADTVRENVETTTRETAAATLATISENLKPIISDLNGQVSELNSAIRSVDKESLSSLSVEIGLLKKSMKLLGETVPLIAGSMRNYSQELSAGVDNQRTYNSASVEIIKSTVSLDKAYVELKVSSENTSKALSGAFANLDLPNIAKFKTELSGATNSIALISDRSNALVQSIDQINSSIGVQMKATRDTLATEARELQESSEALTKAMISLVQSMKSAAKEMTT